MLLEHSRLDVCRAADRRGGYIRVFNRMHCVFDLSDRTRNVFYCDTIHLLGGAASPSTKKTGERGKLSGLSAPICGASGLCLVNLHDFVVIAFRYIFNINHHPALAMKPNPVQGSEFNFYILPLAERRLMCSVSSR